MWLTGSFNDTTSFGSYSLITSNNEEIFIGNSITCSSLTDIVKLNETKNNFVTYPNPVNSKITIDANDVIDIKLFDVLGKQITSTKEKEIDVSNFNDGVYFIQVQTKENISTQKIIVQH